MLIAGEVGLSLVGDTLTLPLVIRKKRIDDGYADQRIFAIGEQRGTTRPYVLRPLVRRARRAATREKVETASPELENVSIEKPQPLQSPAKPPD
jgi:hypothetical protein